MMPSGGPTFAYSPQLCYFRPIVNGPLMPRYLYYWFKTEEFWNQADALKGQTDMADFLSLSDVYSLKMRIPPLGEQVAAIDILGSLDDKIAANERVLHLCTELSDIKFAYAVNGIELSGKSFGDIAEVGGGGTPNTSIEEYWNGDILWATPTDVTGLAGPYLFSTSRMITQAGLGSCNSALYPKGSILMTSRATVGAFAIAQSSVAVNQGFIVVNAKDPRYQLWLFHEMRARVAEFVSHANGATFLELGRGRFKQFRVRIPDVELAHSFSQEVGTLHALASHMISESEKVASVRDELLPLLMSGKIRVREAENIAEGVV
jgi:type I restriction enzyme, S subunit